ncbi:hypothetical protein [Oligoflexus tunisiensis]|uniref:hypothetical protein n=1 Tax=Oligoflexus tunisiensis TaxID=708132 RepID=UPI00114CEE89|nr:hypothetical protein [Oligoflexus tunisiensis]
MQEILAQSIREWLEAKPNRSLRMLARLTSISYSSVRRAAEGTVEQTQEIVLPIASFVMSPGRLSEFIRAYFPKLEKAVLDVYYPANDSDDIIDFILSEEHSAIIMLSSSRQGTTREEVVTLFGDVSAEYFDDIEASGVLTEIDGRLYLEKDIGGISLHQGRRLLTLIVRSCSRKGDSIPFASYANAGWESLTPEATKDVYRIMERTGKEVHAIASNPENRGDVLVAFGMLHNVIKGAEKI